MVTDMINLLKLPHKNILFASSMGTEISSTNYNQTLYNNAKIKCEELIKSSNKNYIILKIPRVYGLTRTKGLIQTLRLNKPIELNKIIEYMDITDFVEETCDNLSKLNTNNIIYYKNISTSTISEIKKRYIKEIK